MIQAERPAPVSWQLAVRWALSGGLLALVGLQLQGRWEAMASQVAAIDPVPACGALLALAVFFAVSAEAWRRLVAGLGGALTYREAFHTVYYANVAKYLPGSVWSLVGRVVLCKRLGVPPLITSAALLMEMIAQVAAGVLVGLLALPAFLGAGGPFGDAPVLLPVALIVAAALGGLHPRVLDTGLKLGEKLLARLGRQRELPRVPYSYSFVLGILALYVANWALMGLGFALLGQALAPGALTLAQGTLLAGAFAVAWNVGVFALFAPAGLGVREAALVVLLTSAFPTGWPALLALASRLWVVLGEALAFAVAVAVAPKGR